MGFREELKKENELLKERTELVVERVRKIATENTVEDKYVDVFRKIAERVEVIEELYDLANSDKLSKMERKDLEELNKRLFDNVDEKNYSNCYGNPKYAVDKFGEMGKILSHLYFSIDTLKTAAINGFREKITIYEELFVAIYNRFEEKDNDFETISNVITEFYHDNSEIMSELSQRESYDPEGCVYNEILKTADLNDLRYLYRFGKNVTDNEIKTAEFINSLPEKDVRDMAHTMVDGFFVGYSKIGKDIHKKKYIQLYYALGFERMVRFAIEEIEKEGLHCVASSPRLMSTESNRQYGYDHKDDRALYLDKAYIERMTETTKAAFEKVKDFACYCAGPACIETFGEKEFNPENKKEACHYDDKQKKLSVALNSAIMQIYTQYVNPEERSFTIIAYPIPEIGPKFNEIFKSTVAVNTLDAKLYEDIQQKLIDALDTADHVEVKGRGNNHTDLTIKIAKINDPANETAFENCVADVNIPVGEVFTSPVLEGTNGVLHVGEVFLSGYKVNDLEIVLKDGKIESFTCKNNEKEEDNKELLNLLIMHNHETLPIGEFAIGTNTTAYKMGIDFDIQAKLPILIAEKTGPHFAMGDTCFSREEEVVTKNPDGKKMIAKENSVSALRSEDPSKAYLNCHTDITIPYNELDTIIAVSASGERIKIIEGGFFVLPGTEELNKPLNELYK